MARDATARLYDVDADAIVMDKKAGTITFLAKKGRLVNLDQLHESVWATRLGDGTGMKLHRLEVTAVGEAAVAGKEIVLKVRGAAQPYVLGPNADDLVTFPRLREALARGEKVVSVTGVVEGWQGNFTQFLKQLPPAPRRLLVKDFQTARPKGAGEQR